MGSIYHSFVVSTTQSARANDEDFCGISATLKLTENRLSRWELNLHNKLPNAVQLKPDIPVLGTEMQLLVFILVVYI